MREAKRDSKDPLVHARMGEIENIVFTAQVMHERMVSGARNYDFTPDLERANAGLKAKSLMTRAVRQCVEKCVELSGGGGFFKKHPLERLWRDVQAAAFHPLPEAAQVVMSGRLALGLGPV